MQLKMCETCLQPFIPRITLRIKDRAKMRFCSNQCRGKWRATDPKIREHMAQIAASGRAGWTAESFASCRAKMSGPNNHAWKGGATYFRKHGNYKPIRYVRCPLEFQAMARKDGYVMEHRLIMARLMGRPLLRVEVVHHIDHDPQNNAPINLELWPDNRSHKLAEHGRFVEGAANRVFLAA